MPDAHGRQRGEGWPRVAALAAAGALGLWEAGRTALADPQRFTFEIAGKADVAFAQVRGALSPGERVGLVIPGRSEADDQVRWFTAQYALAPAIVTPVRYAACARALTDPSCGVERLDRVLVWGVQPASVAPLASALERAPLGMAGPVLVLGRKAP